jgi:hypothetical protein
MTPAEAVVRLARLQASWVAVAEEVPDPSAAIVLRQCAEDVGPLLAVLEAAVPDALGPPAGIPTQYANGLVACATLAELQAHVRGYAELAQDASVIVGRMGAEDWTAFHEGLPGAQRGEASEDWIRMWGALLVPEPMLTGRVTGGYLRGAI